MHTAHHTTTTLTRTTHTRTHTTHLLQAMSRVMANPEFVAAAESLGRNLMTQV